ncbi:MAG TPA: NAD(P)H-dependent oxidoreductase [Chthoniobacteraceae bacterium]|nr:NAD(P)H-dependent oxidoreductase [Chthoniobacteraceae bacterium]
MIDGHPREDSLGAAIAASIVKGASSRHAECRMIRLRELEFDPVHREQPLEPELESAQSNLKWAQILVFVYPTWWGTSPALLKGFLDRVLRPGFAFEERTDGGWRGLLSGRCALLVTTMDTPYWVYRWLLGAPGDRAMRGATLGFCGIGRVSIIAFGPIRSSTPDQRRAWLAHSTWAGRCLEQIFFTGRKAKLLAWLTVARLNFYAEPWLAFTLGAIAAHAHTGGRFHWAAYLLSYASVVLLEFITVLTNELTDVNSDRINDNASLLTGGSQMLVSGRLSQAEVCRGRVAAFALFAMTFVGAAFVVALPWPALLLMLIGLILGIGYSCPPIRLSARGLGEVDVAITHSFLVVLAGWFSQSASSSVLTPWVLSLPLALAVFPSITLAAFPDHEADAATGKRTLAVRIGKRRAAIAAGVFAMVAAILPLSLIGIGPNWYWWCSVPSLPHAVWLCWRLRRYVRNGCPSGRIDGLLVISLSLMLWFCIVPLVALVFS